jgi:UDP:flavonoid glycosyltransferase YjiC (YdhE family)
MRILVASTAGEGHFEPLVPFARAAQTDGHDVRVAAPASFAEQVQAAGLRHEPFPDADPERMRALFASLASMAPAQAHPVEVSARNGWWP